VYTVCYYLYLQFINLNLFHVRTCEQMSSLYTLTMLITSAEEGGSMSVCLSVSPSDNWKSCERILTKFLGG